jgi:hypothetical protein
LLMSAAAGRPATPLHAPVCILNVVLEYS